MDGNRNNFWIQCFALVTLAPRTTGVAKDFAKRTYPHHGLRFITQNLKKPSGNTHEIMALRSRDIFADTIWVAPQGRLGGEGFTHRINVRRFDNEDGHWEAWLLKLARTAENRALATYPTDGELSLNDGLDLIKSSQKGDS